MTVPVKTWTVDNAAWADLAMASVTGVGVA